MIGATLVFLNSSCEKYLDYEGEDAKPRLVLNGTFTPDSVFSVELSNSSGYINKGSLNTIPYGKVAVFDSNGQFLDSLNHTTNGIYRGTQMASANKSYTVKASAGRLGSVWASDYIPEAVPIISWDTTTTSFTEFDNTQKRLQIEYTINDPGGSENFYEIELYLTQEYYLSYQYDPNTGTQWIDTVFYDQPFRSLYSFSTADPILLSELQVDIGETMYYANSLAYSDALFNGKNQTFRIVLDYYQGGANIDMELKSCSEAYYKYKRTLENYYYTEGDPFSQPVQVFNNIENGGLGIWAGYATTVVNIQ